MNTEKNYVVCGYKTWNKKSFDSIISTYPGIWHFISSKDDLTMEFLDSIQPRYVFFIHWSWIVPVDMLTKYECVNFHLTDLPYGRGGSPLQNIMMDGHREMTKLSSIRMTEELDAGPVYFKTDLSMDGSAQEILIRQSDQSAKMIKRIITEEMEPTPQKGNVTLFERRKPEQSEIPKNLSLQELYDFIRMLDGEGYPPAFAKIDCFRYEYTNAILYDDHLETHVRIVPEPIS